MSFFSNIGKFFKTAVDDVTKVANAVRKPLDFITQPMDKLTGAVDNLVNPLIDKLPFGIGSFVKPFADKFLNAGINWLATGPLGGFMSTLGTVAGYTDKIDDVLNTVDRAVDGGISGLPTPAQQNVQNGAAWAQAQGLMA